MYKFTLPTCGWFLCTRSNIIFMFSILQYTLCYILCFLYGGDGFCVIWPLGVWGELASYKRLFNPLLQFSRLGTWCPTGCLDVYVLFEYLGGGLV